MTLIPISVLMDEHRVIERAIAALAAYARATANGAELPREDLATLVSFLRDYADTYHHGKEEDILFRVMADCGMPVDGGPLGVMLAEHEQGRRLTASLAGLAEGGAAWGPEERRQLLFAATGYDRLLTEHIQKEDLVLYPMAARMLPDDAWQRIESEFAVFAAQREREDHAGRLKKLAQDLASHYAPDDEPA